MRHGLLPGHTALLLFATAPRLALPSQAPCLLQLWPGSLSPAPHQVGPTSVYHLIVFRSVRWLVTTLLWVTTFPGSGSVTLSASKLYWLTVSILPLALMPPHQAKGHIPSKDLLVPLLLWPIQPIRDPTRPATRCSLASSKCSECSLPCVSFCPLST